MTGSLEKEAIFTEYDKIQGFFNAITHYQIQEKDNKKVQYILIGENGGKLFLQILQRN